MKKIQIIALIICVFVLMLLGIVKYRNFQRNVKSETFQDGCLEGLNNDIEFVIDDEKIAKEYGEVILKNKFPEYFKYNWVEVGAIQMDTEEWGTIWECYTMNNWLNWGINENGFYYIQGGDVFVLFKKSGEVILFDYSM